MVRDPERLDAARRALAEAGIEADVSTAGPDEDVLAIAAPPGATGQVAAIVERLKGLGFRYIALEPPAAG